MKRYLLFVMLSIITISIYTLAKAHDDMGIKWESETVRVIKIKEGLWVVEDLLPEYITPQLLSQLYTLLEGYVLLTDESLYYGNSDPSSAVIRFVSANQSGRFPNSTEGYAGMCERIEWDCTTAPSSTLLSVKYCEFNSFIEVTRPNNMVRYALVQLPEIINETSIQETLGYTIHEMSHLLGTIDGIRCPYHESYSPSAKLEPDPSDSYWWFGVQGIFGLKPDGVVLLALNNRCDKSDDPDICLQLEYIFDQHFSRE